MEANFWHNKWEQNEIGFHEGKTNALLTKYLDQLQLPEAGRLFLPLCGKTRDIAWLLAQGYQVVGIELSPLAIQQLFAELKIEPEISTTGALTRYRVPNLEIYEGDFFELGDAKLGQVNAVYDRAALIALPEHMRKHYSGHLNKITSNAPQLLITLEYDQGVISGPPFSLSDAEVLSHYSATHQVSQLEKNWLEKGLKGKVDCYETAWLLARS